jgi:hypothetical protein
MFKPWYPPTWAEKDDGDIREDMEIFLDDIASRHGVDRDGLRAVSLTVPGAIGNEGNRVLAVFVPSDNIFQDILGKKIYWDNRCGENYFIKVR